MNKPSLLITALFVCFFLNFTTLFAQLDHKKLTGEWICAEASIINPEHLTAQEKEYIDIMKKGFAKARFKFRADGIFTLQLPKNAPEVLNSIVFVNNRKWFLNQESQAISIGPATENVMKIDVKEENGSTYFLIYETPLLLKVEKI
jgi:hypothetical protein